MRTNGFETYSQLQEHLAEVDDPPVNSAGDRDEKVVGRDYKNLVRQIAWLRKEVADMRSEFFPISDMKQDRATTSADRSWSQIATMVAITFIVTEIASRLRFGLAGAVAAPLVASKIDKQLW